MSTQTHLYLLFTSLQQIYFQQNILAQKNSIGINLGHAYLLPLFSHKICQIRIREKHKSGLEVPVFLNISCYNSSCKQMPNLLLNLSNCLISKVFVKMSASCSSVVTCSRVTTFSSTRSLIK